MKIYGYLRVTLEVRYKKDGVDKHSTVPEPDAVFTIDIPEGNYDWSTLREEIVIDQGNLANVCYFVEGEDYEGEVYVEAPEFAFERFNLVGQFLPHSEDRLTLNWMGQNLSRIEWVGLKIDINGQSVFD